MPDMTPADDARAMVTVRVCGIEFIRNTFGLWRCVVDGSLGSPSKAELSHQNYLDTIAELAVALLAEQEKAKRLHDGLPVGVVVNAPTPDATMASPRPESAPVSPAFRWFDGEEPAYVTPQDEAPDTTQHPKGARESTEGATTAALLEDDLNELGSFLEAMQKVTYTQRAFEAFKRLAATLRAEQEKAKELDRSNAAVVRQHGELQDEIVRLRERLADAEAFTQKYLTAIAQAIGIDSPLILIAHAESNEENYADILLKLVTASGERLATFEALATRAKEYAETLGSDHVMVQNLPAFARQLAALASDDAKGAT